MDRTVPTGAAILLDFIRKTEVGTEARSGYDVIYGHNQGKLSKPVTSMTIDEIQASQRRWSKNYGSSATGGYQFMRATLAGLKQELGLSGSQVLDPDLQDRLGYHLLIRRGYHQFMSGEIGPVEFAKRLAMEWASFPVLAATKGAHRSIQRGQSYYAGDGLNKALVRPEQIEGLLDRAKTAEVKAPEIKPVPVEVPGLDKPLPQSTTVWSAIGSFVASIFAALGDPWVQALAIIVIAGFAFWIIRERKRKREAQRDIKAAIAGAE